MAYVNNGGMGLVSALPTTPRDPAGPLVQDPMTKKLILLGAAAVGGLLLVYLLTRKKPLVKNPRVNPRRRSTPAKKNKYWVLYASPSHAPGGRYYDPYKSPSQGGASLPFQTGFSTRKEAEAYAKRLAGSKVRAADSWQAARKIARELEERIWRKR